MILRCFKSMLPLMLLLVAFSMTGACNPLKKTTENHLVEIKTSRKDTPASLGRPKVNGAVPPNLADRFLPNDESRDDSVVPSTSPIRPSHQLEGLIRPLEDPIVSENPKINLAKTTYDYPRVLGVSGLNDTFEMGNTTVWKDSTLESSKNLVIENGGNLTIVNSTVTMDGSLTPAYLPEYYDLHNQEVLFYYFQWQPGECFQISIDWQDHSSDDMVDAGIYSVQDFPNSSAGRPDSIPWLARDEDLTGGALASTGGSPERTSFIVPENKGTHFFIMLYNVGGGPKTPGTINIMEAYLTSIVVESGGVLNIANGSKITASSSAPIGAGVLLIQDGADVTISDSGISNYTSAHIEDNDVLIRNTTFESTDPYRFIVLNGMSSSIVNNSFIGGGTGIWVVNGAGSSIANNSFFRGGTSIGATSVKGLSIRNNTITDYYRRGILALNSTELLIDNNTIKNCVKDWTVCVQMIHCNNSEVYNNTISHSLRWGISLNFYCENNTISENILTNSSGIELFYYCENNTISGNKVSDSIGYGICVDLSANTTLFNNVVANCSDYGILLVSSGNSTLQQNLLTENAGFGLYPSGEYDLPRSVIDNTLNGLPIGYFSGLVSSEITGVYAQLILVNSSSVTVHDITLHSGSGILLALASDCEITNNEITDSFSSGIRLRCAENNKISGNNITNSAWDGIHFYYSCTNNTVSGNIITNSGESGFLLSSSSCTNNTVSGNTITNSAWDGIRLYSGCVNNTVSGNNVTSSAWEGIRLWDSCANNTVSGNTIANSDTSGILLWKSCTNNTVSGNNVTSSAWDGIRLWDSCANNTVSGNNVSKSLLHGIYLSETGNCKFWNNYLAGNDVNAHDDNISNQWDNGTHGNWWDDYFGPDWDDDGIGDIPYQIPGNAAAQDRYPLVNIIDNDPPDIDAPEDDSYIEGTIGHNITWHPTDPHPAWYNITINGAVEVDTVWDGSAIFIVIDGLVVGTYDYTLVVYDRKGNWTSDSVQVTVLADTTAPTINRPADITYQEGTIGQLIIWQPTDLFPANYTVYRNNTIIESGNWTGGDIRISIAGLTPGIYNYTLVVFDNSGNWASDSVWVTVTARESSDRETTTISASKSKEGPGFTIGVLIVSGLAIALVHRQFHQRSRKQ